MSVMCRLKAIIQVLLLQQVHTAHSRRAPSLSQAGGEWRRSGGEWRRCAGAPFIVAAVATEWTLRRQWRRRGGRSSPQSPELPLTLQNRRRPRSLRETGAVWPRFGNVAEIVNGAATDSGLSWGLGRVLLAVQAD